MLTSEEQITSLQAKIDKCLRDRDERSGDREIYLALTNEISNLHREKMLLMGLQQGKFASRISVVVSHSYRSHIFARSLSTSPLHPSRFGKYAR